MVVMAMVVVHQPALSSVVTTIIIIIITTINSSTTSSSSSMNNQPTNQLHYIDRHSAHLRCARCYRPLGRAGEVKERIGNPAAWGMADGIGEISIYLSICLSR
jgi:hypothetical protein